MNEANQTQDADALAGAAQAGDETPQAQNQMQYAPQPQQAYAPQPPALAALSSAVRAAFDPLGLFNPGRL